MSKIQLQDQTRASSFTGQKLISLIIVAHILFAVNGVFPKDLEPTMKEIKNSMNKLEKN